MTSNKTRRCFRSASSRNPFRSEHRRQSSGNSILLCQSGKVLAKVHSRGAIGRIVTVDMRAKRARADARFKNILLYWLWVEGFVIAALIIQLPVFIAG
ncbi:unnamed protein product, partial [Brenthis ino]